jgi:glycosyltransferase involved in cell wall biosynthesis
LFRHVYGIADDEIAVGIVGRLVPIKNHDLFLEVVAHTAQRTGRKLRAFIVGDGEERERLSERAAALGLSQAAGPRFNGHGFGHGVNGKPAVPRATLTFTSWIKEIDVVNAGLDIVLLTSLNEGTPVSLIEAQASNRPVLCTRVGGTENVVLDGRTGLLCDSGDADALTERLTRLVEDDALRERMGRAGWEHVRDRYHYTRLVGDTERLYRALLG